MAEFLTYDEERSRGFLGVAGVRILSVDDPDVNEVMVEILGEETQERASMVAQPPADAESSETGMGAWHINSGDEFQTVVSGRGIVEFMTDKGAVAVLLEAGDIMVVEQAEHRYRPLTDQEWILRFAGEDLVGTETGRVSGPWPIP